MICDILVLSGASLAERGEKMKYTISYYGPDGGADYSPGGRINQYPNYVISMKAASNG
jgi:hypothetical protein